MTQGNGGTTRPDSKHEYTDAQLDRMVDAYFDRELSVSQRRKMFDHLTGKGGRCEDIARMQRILAQLRTPPEEIDIADEVIGQIHRRRSFLSPAMRSAIRIGRVAVAASVLLALLGIVVVQRIAPDATVLSQESTPVTALMHDTGSELSQIRINLAGATEHATRTFLAQVARAESGLDAPIDGTMELAVFASDFASESAPPNLYLPGRDHPQMAILSGAGDTTLVTWYSDMQEGAPRGFTLESVATQTQGFRTVESRVISLDLSARVEGERARVTPYSVEHFKAGALPVSFDPEMIKGVLRLISRDVETPDVSNSPHR